MWEFRSHMFIVYGPLLAQTVIKHHLITLFQHLSSPEGAGKSVIFFSL